jgi:hypothetical protein
LTASSRFESRDEYAALVERMVGRGASVSEQQMPVLLDYLFKTYGERGKATVNAACTGCHARMSSGASRAPIEKRIGQWWIG